MSYGVRFASVALLTVLFTAGMTRADHSTHKLTNNSKPPEAYYLVKDRIISQADCIVYRGNDRINPGESASFDIKESCKWGVVVYRVFDASNNLEKGTVAQSYRDGETTIEVKSHCKGNDCVFYDMNPRQDR
ncbi:MAG: hypothetical protein AB7V27_10560 [Candidatus Binatia bacterium]